MSSKLPTHIQYRNATYYGIVQNYQRNGHGLLILDNSHIIMAQWRKNSMHGKYIYIADNSRAYGSMINNRLDGYNILWLKADKDIRYERFIYGMFREDKLYGKAIIIDNNMVMVGQYVNNQLKQVISKSTIKDRQVFQALKQHFPKNQYTLEEYLLSFIKEAVSKLSEQDQIPRYLPIVNNFGEVKFFGYEECFNKGKRYGFVLHENKVVSIGEHFNSNLEGIGRYYSEEGIEDGIFKDGYLSGIGIKYNKQGNRYTIGQHDGQSPLQKGFGFPNRQICQIRKQFHLRSIYFYNDIIMLGINTHLMAIFSNIMSQGRPKRIQSPKFQQQFKAKSPIRPNLYKYQIQQDYIEETSPIKDKFSQYKPATYQKAEKHFLLDKDEEEYDRKRQKQKYFPNYQNNNQNIHNATKNNRNSIDKQGLKDKSSGSRFYQNPSSKEEAPNSRVKGVIENRDRSASRGGNRVGVKDTKQLLKQLQQQQKRKRLDLDKIYQQAGLYKKK